MNEIISLDYQSRTPIYEQIIKEIERYVALGILKPNQQIPSIRELAASLGINPNTVKKAYTILENKKIIVSISTKGTFICENIDKVKDASEALLLRYRYINGYGWEEISELMNYSPRNIHYLHKKALKAVAAS